MQNGEETSGLVETLGQHLIERFNAQGWTEVAEAPIPHTGIGGFTVPLDDDFSAIASFAWRPETLRPAHGSDRPDGQRRLRRGMGNSTGRLDASGLIVEGGLGVVCRPVERFLSAFVGTGICGVLLNSPMISVVAHRSPDVDDAADQLAAFELDRAVPLTERYADLNALVEVLGEHLAVPFIGEGSLGFISQEAEPGATYPPLAEDEAEFVPTLLALAGHHDDARQMLARYVPSDDVPRHAQDDERRRHRRFARQLTRWLDASDELALPTTLDEEPNVEPDQEPELLAPPDRAAYKVWNVAPRWTAVALDPMSRSWLDRVVQSDPGRHARGREVEVWLTWDAEPHVADSHIAVHIGAERVGVLDPDATENFRLVMKAAAERDEDPCGRARLTRMSGQTPYVLEVALPHTAASASSTV